MALRRKTNRSRSNPAMWCHSKAWLASRLLLRLPKADTARLLAPNWTYDSHHTASAGSSSAASALSNAAKPPPSGRSSANRVQVRSRQQPRVYGRWAGIHQRWRNERHRPFPASHHCYLRSGTGSAGGLDHGGALRRGPHDPEFSPFLAWHQFEIADTPSKIGMLSNK